jgi:hypothetical protein
MATACLVLLNSPRQTQTTPPSPRTHHHQLSSRPTRPATPPVTQHHSPRPQLREPATLPSPSIPSHCQSRHPRVPRAARAARAASRPVSPAARTLDAPHPPLAFGDANRRPRPPPLFPSHQAPLGAESGEAVPLHSHVVDLRLRKAPAAIAATGRSDDLLPPAEFEHACYVQPPARTGRSHVGSALLWFVAFLYLSLPTAAKQSELGGLDMCC